MRFVRVFTSHNQVSPKERRDSPFLASGYINLGLAHGVPGPLALLSIAALQGINRANLYSAISKLASWITSQRVEDAFGINWPTYSFPKGDRLRGARAAWCYGSPGIANSLYIAGLALGDVELKEIAISALLAVQKRSIEARAIDSPTFCHGVAGLPQIVLRVANGSQDPGLRQFALELIDQLLSSFEEDALLGFRNIETKSSIVDSPGLLMGALGPALALLSAASSLEPEWDQVFLLS